VEVRLQELGYLIEDYEREQADRSDSLPSAILVATLLCTMPEPLKGHAEVNADKYADFQDLVRLITEYCAGKKAFLPSRLPSSSSSAMDVDALFKGKGKRAQGQGRRQEFRRQGLRQ
jgi:hypothetical protein